MLGAIGVRCPRVRLPDAARRARPREDESPTTAFMELRAAEAAREGKRRPPRPAMGAVLAHLAEPEAGGAGGGGRRLLGPRGDRPRADARVDRDQLGAGARRSRRQHDHAAAGEEPVSVAVARPAAQAARADHRAPARGGAAEGAHLRDLSERDRVGRRDLGRGGGGANLLWCSGVGAERRAGGAARRRDHQSARAEPGASQRAIACVGSGSSWAAWAK